MPRCDPPCRDKKEWVVAFRCSWTDYHQRFLCFLLAIGAVPSTVAHLVSSVEDSFVAARKNQATKYMRCCSNIVPYLPPSICQKPKASANRTCKKMNNRGEAAELGAVPELELDQVNDQVVDRRRDGAGGEEAYCSASARLRNNS